MTQIEEVVNLVELEREIDSRYINRRYHPDFPELAILNYSDQCQFDNHWNATTRVCRGLIYNTVTGEVLARPFGKFYNYGDDSNTGDLDLDAPILGAFDKADGSLGIQYRTPDGQQAIATRGSFESEQAIHATKWLRDSGYEVMPQNHTWLWEIVYPENRIVLDYGDRDELIYIGSTLITTGEFFPIIGDYEDFSAVSQMPARSLREAISLPNRENAEGVVVWMDSRRAVKIKQDDYLALHRLISHLTPKEVWRQLRAGTYQEFAKALPDEFYQWAQGYADEIETKFAEVELCATADYRDLLETGLETRKDQALWVRDNVYAAHRGLVFSLLDDRDISESIWKMVEP